MEDSGLSESCALSSRYGCRVPPIKMKKTIAFSFFLAGIVAWPLFSLPAGELRPEKELRLASKAAGKFANSPSRPWKTWKT